MATEPNLTPEQKDQMLAWVQEAAQKPRPWWDNCSNPVQARAFVAAHLPHLLA